MERENQIIGTLRLIDGYEETFKELEIETRARHVQGCGSKS